MENGPVEIVSFPIQNAWWIFPVRYVSPFTRPGISNYHGDFPVRYVKWWIFPVRYVSPFTRPGTPPFYPWKAPARDITRDRFSPSVRLLTSTCTIASLDQIWIWEEMAQLQLVTPLRTALMAGMKDGGLMGYCMILYDIMVFFWGDLMGISMDNWLVVWWYTYLPY